MTVAPHRARSSRSRSKSSGKVESSATPDSGQPREPIPAAMASLLPTCPAAKITPLDERQISST